MRKEEVEELMIREVGVVRFNEEKESRGSERI